MIYLDNAATTLRKPPQVAQAMLEALGTLGNAARGAHGGSLGAARTVYETRRKLAALFGCPRADHVIFTANATQALNTAIFGLIGPGDRVVSTDLEHNSVLRPLHRLQKEAGVEVSFVPADRQGRLSLADFDRLIRPGTKAVVCTHASNLTGNLVDLAAVSAVAHSRGALLIADCAQTAGTRPIDMTALGIDVLCFSGHKGLMGPQGTGGLCLREGLSVRPLIVGGTGVQTYLPDQPAQLPAALEAGTLNGCGVAGLGAAVDFLMQTGLSAVQERETGLLRRFYDGVRELPYVRLYGDFSGDRAAVAALNLGGMDSAEAADLLWTEYGIAVRAGAHCAPRMHEALLTREQGAVRFSFSYFNTEQEIDAALDALRELVKDAQ